MPPDPRRVKELFLAALDLPDPAARPAFLDRECGEDNELRRRLEVLIAAHDEPAGEPERPVEVELKSEYREPSAAVEGPQASPIEDGPPPAPIIGSVIAGRYRVHQEIGEGGMGSVYLAEQIRPVRRAVALKLIKAGMDTRTVLARFDSERQALALMDHPNIAKVLDAGATDAGRPFFVMELVKGVPITDYCDAHRLALPDRLTLFRQVCSAVQHAHQKGIMHRDLKPTNILVESHNDQPVSKVIDFGLAKATSGMRLTDQSLHTALNVVAGTPLYMAPEQVTFNAVDVDTRADIYALGVILYELLTGSTPIRRETFRDVALDEMMRLIREVEPPTPSSRLSTSDALPSLAANRHIEPSRLSRFVKGDLDWIVMKALAKERRRRYDTAIGLANDLERFVNHEPVSAGPPSSTYRLRKFVRRNRVQVIAASLILLTLVGGIVGTTLGLFEARRQEGFAEAQRLRAEKRLGQVEKANKILGSIFVDLNPWRTAEKDDRSLKVHLGEHLDQATAQIEGDAIGDPLTVASMQLTLGESQLGLGNPEKAIILFTKARATLTAQLGPNNPLTVTSLHDLATSHHGLGRFDQALPLYEEALTLRTVGLGPGHISTLNTMSNLSECYLQAGMIERALPLMEKTLSLSKANLGLNDPLTFRSMNKLAFGYQVVGKFDRSLPLAQEAFALTKARLGRDDLITLESMCNLALAYSANGEHDRALPLFEESLMLVRTKLGPNSSSTLIAMNNLAGSYQDAGQLDRALLLFEETFRLMKAKHGPDHPDTLLSMGDLADCYRESGKLDRALPLSEEALSLRKAKFRPDHPYTLTSMGNLADCYRLSGQLDRALPLSEETFSLSRAKLGPDHPETLRSMLNLAACYHAVGKFDRALELFEEVLPLLRSKLGPDHPHTLQSMRIRALAYLDAGKNEQALPLLREWSDYYRRKSGPRSTQYASALASLGRCFLEQRKWTDAEQVLRESLSIREMKEPDVWSTFGTKSLLGGALLGQKKFVEAEPLIRAGYDGMKARAEKFMPQGRARLVGALDRLIDLAEATGKPDEAKAWRDEKTKLPIPSPEGKTP